MSRLLSWTLNGLYVTLLLAAAPWIVWSALRDGKYREGFGEKLLGRVPKREGKRPSVWIHAVSVGEVNLLQTTLTQLCQRQPDLEVFISTTTKTGYDLAQKKYGQHTVFYCPLDFSWAVSKAIERIRPDLLVLAELELWPNLIRLAKQQGTKVAIINGRLSDKSFRGYRRVRPLVSRLLQGIDLIAAQNEETAERFRQLGAANVTVTGSLKFDGATTDRNNPQTSELRKLAGIEPDDIVFLAGSTQSPEEQYAIEIFQQLSPQYPNLRLILVPRHPERFNEAEGLLQQSGIPWIRRTQLEAKHSALRTPHLAILLDTIGELSAWWGVATIGFVGGSFGSRGGQNMLEPAAYGVATCFGPNTRNFRDIVSQLLKVDGVKVVNDRDELAAFTQQALDDPLWAEQLGQRAQSLVRTQLGATNRTVERLLPFLNRPGARQAGPMLEVA